VTRSRAEALAGAERLMLRTNVLYSETVRRTFEVIDATALTARNAFAEYQERGVGSVADPHQFLRALAAVSPVIRGTSWVDTDGNRIFASVSPRLPALSVANQPQFTVHRDDPDIGLYVGTPFRSALDGSWQFLVSRRVDVGAGRFGGVVQVALSLAHFDSIFERIDDRTGLVFGLFRRDGTCLIFSAGEDACFGKRLEPGALAQSVSGAAGASAFRGINSLEGDAAPERIGAYTHLAGLDLVATNSVVVERLLARWRTDTAVEVGFALLAALAILGVGWGTARAVGREETIAARLRAASLAAKGAEAQAASASRAKSAFLSNMSHELRTPLNAVIGFTELLMLDRRGKLDAGQKEHLALVLQGGRHLLSLVNEILDLASIEAGHLKISPEPVAADGAIETALAAMRRQAEERGVTLAASVPSDLPALRVDTQRLHQVLLNLLSNAIKYNRPQGRVDVTAEQIAPGKVRISIADTGIGIPEGQREHMFEPFYRFGAEYTSVEGTGLGLALTKRIVEAMAGRISFESVSGRGSTFRIDLLTVDAAAFAAPATAAAVPDFSPLSPDAVRVLCVDDNTASQALVREICASVPGLAVAAADSAETGLRMAQTARFDIVVLDVNLPGMNGFEALARFRALPGHSKVPVVAMSAAATARDVQRGATVGFFRYLTKPLDIAQFVAAMRAAVRAREIDRAVRSA
jgi:signal transduction histidine kinase/ActR/RegA family two-component response regulator